MARAKPCFVVRAAKLNALLFGGGFLIFVLPLTCAARAGSSNLDDYPLNAKVVAALKVKGVVSLFDVQVQTFPHVYVGRDVVAKARTGTGK